MHAAAADAKVTKAAATPAAACGPCSFAKPFAISEARALDLAPDTSEGLVAYVTETPGREWGASGEITVSFLDALKNNSVQRILVMDDISGEALHREMAGSNFQAVQISRCVPAAGATAALHLLRETTTLPSGPCSTQA